MNYSGITYYKVQSNYSGDTTKGCGLTSNEIDNNFYFLRGYDVKSIYWVKDESKLIVERLNGNKLEVTGITEDFLSQIDAKIGQLNANLSGESNGVSIQVSQLSGIVSDINISAPNFEELYASKAELDNYYTSAQTDSAIAQGVSGKQDILTTGDTVGTINGKELKWGSGITIDVSGGTTYTAGNNIKIENNTISVTGLSTINGSAITEGGNLVIESGSGITYTAGENIEISSDNKISAVLTGISAYTENKIAEETARTENVYSKIEHTHSHTAITDWEDAVQIVKVNGAYTADTANALGGIAASNYAQLNIIGTGFTSANTIQHVIETNEEEVSDAIANLEANKSNTGHTHIQYSLTSHTHTHTAITDWEDAVQIVKVNSAYTADTAINAISAETIDWSGITNTPTTLNEYGITDAYTKEEINTELSKKQNTLTSGDTVGTINGITFKWGDSINVSGGGEGSGTTYYAGNNIEITQDEGKNYINAILTGVTGITDNRYWKTGDTVNSAKTAESANTIDWSGVENKPITIEGYGITDAYTKGETNTQITNAIAQETARTESTYLKEHQSLDAYYTSAQTDSAIAQGVSGKQDILTTGNTVGTINGKELKWGSGITIDVSGGTTYSAGTAITIADDKINVNVADATNNVIDGISTNKNYIKVNTDNKLEVKGVDSDSVVTTEDVELNGGPLASLTTNWPWQEEGKNIVPENITLQEFIKGLFFKIINGIMPTPSYSWSYSIANPIASITNEGARVPVGSAVTLSYSVNTQKTNTHSVVVDCYDTDQSKKKFGYFKNDDDLVKNDYSEYKTGAYTGTTQITSSTWKGGDSAASESVNSGDIKYVGLGTNTLSIVQGGESAICTDLSSCILYASTNTGAKLTGVSQTISTDSRENKSLTSSISKTIYGYYPVFYGATATTNMEQSDITENLLKEFGYDKESVPTSFSTSSGTGTFICAIPQNKTEYSKSKMVLKDAKEMPFGNSSTFYLNVNMLNNKEVVNYKIFFITNAGKTTQSGDWIITFED